MKRNYWLALDWFLECLGDVEQALKAYGTMFNDKKALDLGTKIDAMQSAADFIHSLGFKASFQSDQFPNCAANWGWLAYWKGA